MYLFETERLRFRELTGDDAQFGFDLNSDPEVIQYTGDPPFESVEAAREFMAAYTEVYRKNGYGRWGAELKSTGELIGWCGLKFHEEEKVTDVGYRLFKKHWGKGYASEAALQTIAYGFNHMRLNRIVAHARKENVASIRVLEKCGMKIIGEGTECGGEIFVFEIFP
ncbi:MAG TPA: GNAT family N-acetyltransferase [Bacteroidia bacterium]|nr:GNAT family N-acetyltransferase [Bacteroidia bacterium]